MVAIMIIFLVIYDHTCFASFFNTALPYSETGNGLRIVYKCYYKASEWIAFTLDSYYFLHIFIDFYI